MAKAKKVFGTIMSTILIVAVTFLMIIGLICFFSLAGTVGTSVGSIYQDNFPIFGDVAVTTIYMFTGFQGVFGGEAKVDAKYTYNGSETKLDELTTANIATNPYIYVALTLVILGFILFLIFYKKRVGSLFSFLFLLSGSVLLLMNSYFFMTLNQDLIKNLSMVSVSDISVLDIGSICLGIITSIITLLSLVHLIVLLAKKS